MKTNKSSGTYIGTFYQSNTYYNLGLQTKNNSGRGSFWGSEPNKPLFLCTGKEPVGGYKKHFEKKTRKTLRGKYVMVSTKMRSNSVYSKGAHWEKQGLNPRFTFFLCLKEKASSSSFFFSALFFLLQPALALG